MQKTYKGSSKTKLLNAKQREEYEEELVAFVTSDFESRQKMRAQLESQWELNVNFLKGNQYCHVNGRGEIVSEDKQFYWQNKLVYNHVAPIIETRLSKLARVKPEVFVRPNSDDDADVDSSDIAEKFLEDVFKRSGVNEVVKKVTTWSETCGTGFYKIVWDNEGGNSLGVLDGREVKEGDVQVLAVSPFEIFPDNLFVEDLASCESIIHAKVMPVSEVKSKYNVVLSGGDVDVLGLNKGDGIVNKPDKSNVMPNAVVVIERYEKPCEKYPNGRLITVADGKLLYVGELPYVNDVSGRRTFPFVKQESISVAGEFFGKSIIERLIPVQRAFNAVKNRKHEFLSRLSMGVMTVEDGSVDTDDLAQEGLSPGKVLVYRQGAKAPEMMSLDGVPSEFSVEEERLLNEFVIISGVSDVVSSTANAKVSSGTSLEILVEQDNERLAFTAERIRCSYLEIAKQTLRLYAQFVSGMRAVKYQDRTGKVKIAYASPFSIAIDDVYLDGENELLSSYRSKKDMLFKLHESGLLLDENGQIRSSTKEKLLTLLGYKDLDYRKGASRLQEEKAQAENPKIRKLGMQIEEIDDDAIHVEEHTRYILGEYQYLTAEEKQRLFDHVKEHKQRINDKLKGE
ncbi:MAG: hypothetical protein IKZ38_03365 [Clostridia bacterium]|nr:hypothetical protein [Clostridia bacterium]